MQGTCSFGLCTEEMVQEMAGFVFYFEAIIQSCIRVPRIELETFSVLG